MLLQHLSFFGMYVLELFFEYGWSNLVIYCICAGILTVGVLCIYADVLCTLTVLQVRAGMFVDYLVNCPFRFPVSMMFLMGPVNFFSNYSYSNAITVTWSCLGAMRVASYQDYEGSGLNGLIRTMTQYNLCEWTTDCKAYVVVIINMDWP